MPDITATAFLDEAYVLVQADWSGTILRDTYQRIATTTWQPAADTGQVYVVVAGVGTDFPVNGTQGQIVHSAVNTTKRIRPQISALNVDITGTFYVPVAPTGGDFTFQILARFVDINNLVDVRYGFTAAGNVTVVLRQIIGGAGTSSSTVNVAGLLTSGVYQYRFLVNSTFLAARIWAWGTPEPATWAITFNTAWLTAGDIVPGTTVAAGVTNPVPITFALDDLVVVDPNAAMSNCAIVTRTNTVTGETVQLRPYVFYNDDGALILECGQGLWWDTEPPLNVELEYCTFPCDAPVTVTGNPDFDSGITGWTASNGATLTQDCTVAKVGTCSGRITPNGTTSNPTISQTGFMLAANRQVTMSTWAMSPQGWNSVLLRLTVTYSDLTSEILETPLVTLDDNEWRFLSLTFTPQLPITSATFAFIAAGLPPNTTLFNVDDLKVEQLTAVAGTDCESVTVESDSVWLKSPLHPCDDVEIGLCSPMLLDCEETARVSYVGTSDDNYAPNSVVLSPVNRQFPLPISRIRRAPTATLRLLAHDCDARDAVLQINEPGDVLLFQAPADYCIPDRYITVGALDETRISVDQREEFRLMTLPYATVERPDGPMDGPCGTRIQDLCDIYTSWNALSIAGLSWTDLLLGNASPNGPGQPDPPAAARDWDEVEAEFVDWDDVEAGGTRDWDELRDGL